MSELPVFRVPIISNPSAPATIPTFESCLGTFTADSLAYRDGPLEPPTPLVASAVQVLPSQVETIDPATSKRCGGITQDREKRRPSHEWNSLEEFHAWRVNEELDYGIELRLSSTRHSGGPLWHEKRIYSCSRQGTGGQSKYVRKRMDRIMKLPSKRTGCGCRVKIKTYPHVSTVLGWYQSEHDHAIGIANLMYTRLRDSTRGYVLNLLRMNMSPKEVFTRVRRAHGKHERGHYITMQDIYRFRKIVKREEATRSMSSDGDDEPNYEHSEGSPIKDDEEPTIQPEVASETGSTTEVDEVLSVLDDESDSDGYPDPGILTSSPPGSVTPHLYTASSSTDMEFTPSPVMPTASMEPAVSPAASMGSTALPVVPATQPTHYTVPPVPPPHDMPPQWFMPPPIVAYIPYPPYQMTLYPLYPVYLPPPTR